MLLEKGPIHSGLYSQAEIKKIASSISSKHTLQTSGISFIAGLPGGLAMAGTIPADTAQFYGFALRSAQEIAYLYGAEDLWKDNELQDEKVNGELMLYLGAMLGVSGAASLIRVISARVAAQVAKKLPQQALTKTLWYPLAKTIASYLGVKLTKDTTARGISKTIPVLGGVLSGGMTYYAMSNMSKRLINAFDEGVIYTKEEEEADKETIKREMPDVFDAIFTEIK